MAELSRATYNLTHKTGASPVFKNEDASSRFRYTYQTTSKGENGDYNVTSHYKFGTDGAQAMQDVGDGAALAGTALTVSVVGAEVGVPLAAAGSFISTAGSIWEAGLNLLNGDYGNSIKDAAFVIGGKLVEKGLDKVLPGAGKTIKDESFDLGSELLRQGANLKVSGAERVVDAVVEKKKQEEQK